MSTNRPLFKIGDVLITTEDIQAYVRAFGPAIRKYAMVKKYDRVLKSPENPNGMSASKYKRYLERQEKNKKNK